MFSIVKRYYNLGFYNEDKVAVFVRAGQLSAEEYQQITGKEYAE